jgi:hypothetical protein
MSSQKAEVVSNAVGVVHRENLTTIEGISRLLKSIGETFQACQTDRENAHIHGEAFSPLNGRQPIFALLGYQDLQTIEGRLLTIVDASFSDQQQRKAVKDLIRNAIWFDWVPYLDTDNGHSGKPDLNR